MPAARDESGGAARLHLDRARDEVRNGSLERGWQECLAAAAIARSMPDPELLAEAATVLSEPTLMWTRTGARQALCFEALGLLGAPTADEAPTLPQWRRRVRAHLDGLSTGWAEHRGDLSRDAPPDASFRFAELQTAYLRSLGISGVFDRLVLAHQAVRLGRAADDDHIEAWGWHWRADALEQLGLRADFLDAVRELSAVVERAASPVWHWRLTAIHANIALLDGRIADVAPLARRALAEGRDAGVADADLFDLILRGVVAVRTGSGVAGVEEEVRLLIADAPYFAQGWRAELLLALGRMDEVETIYRMLMGRLDQMPTDVHEWLVGHVTLAEIAVALDDRDGAARLRGLLLPAAHLHAAGPATTPYGGPVALPLAKLSAVLGDQDAVRRFAADALARAEAMQAPWHATAAREFAAARPHALPPLSTREDEIARLVAQGRTNREIATMLFLSERTVEQHVRSILHKLGLPNRAAVAAWVVEQR